MIEDNGDPYNPASAAYVGQAAAEAEAREDAYDSALGSAPSEDDQAQQATHDGLFRHKMQLLAKIVDEKKQEYELKRSAATAAKAELDAAYEDLHKAAKDEQQFLPFEHPTEEPSPSVETVPGQTAALHEQDESWRAVPLETALDGLSKGIFDSLRKNDPPLEMLGDLADWTKDHTLVDIAGIGKGKGEKIEESLMRFWERWAKAAQPVQSVAPEEQAVAEPAPEPDHSPEIDRWHAEGNPNDVQPDAVVSAPEPAGGEIVDAEFTLSNDPQPKSASAYAGRL